LNLKIRSGMMRSLQVLVFGAVLAIASMSIALGQASQPAKRAAGSSIDNVAETVSVLDHVWLDAAHNRDTDTMAWLFADGFVEVHPGGEMVNKQQQIDQIKDPSGELTEIHPDDIQVRYTSPDVAFLTDTTTIRARGGGKNYNGRYRVIRVFVKQGGRWRAAGAGITLIANQ
jgi:ketosteroid isomerase-like protein